MKKTIKIIALIIAGVLICFTAVFGYGWYYENRQIKACECNEYIAKDSLEISYNKDIRTTRGAAYTVWINNKKVPFHTAQYTITISSNVKRTDTILISNGEAYYKIYGYTNKAYIERGRNKGRTHCEITNFKLDTLPGFSKKYPYPNALTSTAEKYLQQLDD